MKNKNGFTLVELLAVIAILAILVIIALPNVMSMFNRAKKSSFETEVKQIYELSKTQWMSDSLGVSSEKTYSQCNNGCNNPIKSMDARKGLNYYVKLSGTGNVTSLYVTDGTYQYEYNGGNLKKDEIGEAKIVADLTSGIITIENNEVKYDNKPVVAQEHMKKSEDINIQLKKLANPSNASSITSPSYVDRNVNSIKKATSLPSGFNKTKEENILSTDPNEPVYAWFSGGSLYIYKESGKIVLNGNSSYLFAYFENLNSIDLSLFDTSKVSNMTSMFEGIRNTNTINISSFSSENLTTTTNMFKNCQNLNNIIFGSSFTTKKVTDMSYMFSGSQNINSLDLSNFSSDSLTNVEGMFSGCQNLRSVKIGSNFTLNNVTSLYRMFYGTNLQTFTGSNYIVGNKVTTTKEMFSGCQNLQNLDLSNFTAPNLTDATNMFYRTNNMNVRLNNIQSNTFTGMFSGSNNLQNVYAKSDKCTLIKSAYPNIKCNAV